MANRSFARARASVQQGPRRRGVPGVPTRAASATASACVALGGLLAVLAQPAHAIRFETEGGMQVNLDSTISLGVQVRLAKPSVTNVGNDNGGSVPTSGAIGGRVNGDTATSNPDFNFLNGDDGNLNYKQGDITSLALKGTHELGLKWGDGWKSLARGTWVYDAKVGDTRRTELSNDAKNLAERNITLLDAWISKDLKLINGQPATFKLGNQVISWGEDIFVSGGINSINALDLRKIHTPGTQVKEILRPAPMAYLNAGLVPDLNLEAYYQFKWNSFQFDPVGTFFSAGDVVGKGQRPAYIPSSLLSPLGLCGAPACGDNGAGIQEGVNVLPFEPDRKPPQGRQFGAALRGKAGKETEWALYWIRYHDKLPFTTLFIDPAYTAYNVLGAGYYNEYGRNKNLFGTSFNTKIGPLALGGELSYRPKDSVAIDPSVPLAGPYSIFDNATPGATKTVDPVTGRNTVRGFVDEKKFQAHLAGFYFIEVNSPLGQAMKALGAAEGFILAEAAVTYYPKLDPDKIPYLIFPSYAVPTKTSGGYVIEVALTYPDVFGSGVNLTPQIDFVHDVFGVSPNALPFVKGRKSVFLGVNYDVQSVWRGQVGVSYFFGGGLNNAIRDRSFFSASVSYAF